MQTDITPTAPVCKECGTNLGPGREDRKYCSDLCRTSYNNKRRREKQEQDALPKSAGIGDYISRIQEILLRNRQILSDLCPGDEALKMQKRDLEGRGFNFKYFTSESPTRRNDAYRFCFELGYKEVEDGGILIVRREREVIC